jgi:hypothetical protein
MEFMRGLSMRILLFLAALVVVGLIVTGAITLTRTDDQKITIQIDRARVREDAAKAFRKGKAVLEDAESALRRPPTDTSTK